MMPIRLQNSTNCENPVLIEYVGAKTCAVRTRYSRSEFRLLWVGLVSQLLVSL